MKRLLSSALDWLRPKPARLTAAERMRADWDQRARQNPHHFVATSREQWTDADFFQSGMDWTEEHIVAGMPSIARGRTPAQMRVLEIGCGVGRLTHALAGVFGTVYGVDISFEMLRHARTALGGKGNIQLCQNSGTDLAMFAGQTFDFAVSWVVLQHIPTKAIVRGYIEEVSRVLRSDSIFKCQLQGYPIAEHQADTWTGVGFSEDEMEAIARTCGLEILKSSGAGTQYYCLDFLKRQ